MSYPRIIAHRCGGRLAPENSLAGLAVAADIGCRAVEFDIMLSADGVPVLMHDLTIERTTDGQGAVADLSVAALRRAKLGGEPIPLLAEALARCAALGLWANIELKPPAGGEAMLGQVVGAWLRENWNGQGVVSSFSEAALREARRAAPDLAYALLVEALPADWRQRVRRLGVVAIHGAASQWTEADIATVREAGLQVAVYTVNQRATADRLLAFGVAVFTDRPELWLPSEM